MIVNLVLIAGLAVLLVVAINIMGDLFREPSSVDTGSGFGLLPLLFFAPFFFGGVAILAIAMRSRVAAAVTSSLIPVLVAIFVVFSLITSPLEPVLWFVLFYPLIFLCVAAGTINEDMNQRRSIAVGQPRPPITG